MTINDLTYQEKIEIAKKRKNMTWQDIGNELGISAGYARDLVFGNRGNGSGGSYREKINEILGIEND